MNKVFSYLKGNMTNWVAETHSEEFTVDDYIHLGEDDSRDYYSFNPATVTLAEQDEKFDVKVYDASNKDDQAELLAAQPKLAFLRQQSLDIKGKLFAEYDIFEVLTGLANQDKYVIKHLADLKEKHAAYLKNLGF